MKLAYFCMVLLLMACNSSSENEQENYKQGNFIYVSHTRLCTGVGADRVDVRFSKINWDAYDVKIHGGDVLCQTSKEPERLKRACSTFGFLDSNSIWVKGNHDDDSLGLLNEYLGLTDPFRVMHKGAVTFVVLDYFMTEEPFNSHYFTDELRKVDLKNTKHLIVLTHYLYWTYQHPEMEGLDKKVSNVAICEHSEWCLFPNDFMEKIYPVLIEFKNEGVLDVICLAGDAGNRRRTFEFKDQNGIDFLACGVSNESPADSVLIFNTMADVSLNWEFVALDDLIN